MKFFNIVKLLFLPIVSSIFLGLVFYKIISPYFIFLAFIPLFLFLNKVKNWKQAFFGGYIAGCVYFAFILISALHLRWFGFMSSEKIFIKASYAIVILIIGIFWGLFAVSVFWFWKKEGIFIKNKTISKWHLLIIIPSLWIFISEIFRQKIFWNFSWGFLGYLTEDIFWFRQITVISGILGLSFLIVFFNIDLFLIFQKLKRRNFQDATIYASVIFIVFISVIFFTKYSQRKLEIKDELSVAVIQAAYNLPVDGFHNEPYFSLVNKAKAQNPDLIVLPESIFKTWYKGEENSAIEYIQTSVNSVMGDFRGMVVFGGYHQDIDNNMYNSLFLWENGKIIDKYDKRNLVPFAEYRPRFLSIFAPQSVVTYKHGEKQQSFEGDSIALGAFICQEVIFADAIRKDTLQRGSDILVTGANDGIVEFSPFLYKLTGQSNEWLVILQHTMARFRAIENGRYLLRSTKDGIASIIDPFGGELARVNAGYEEVIFGKINKVGGLTPYVRFGDKPLIIFSFIVLLVCGIIKYKKNVKAIYRKIKKIFK